MKISVIITAYNYGHYLDQCLASLIAQSFPDNAFEIIVVDDHSTDDTPKRMAVHTHTPQIRSLRNAENLGVAASANRGIQAAAGEFVVRVDADDHVAPAFLAELHHSLSKNPEALGAACDYLLVNDKGRMLKIRSAKSHPIACGVLFKRRALLDLGAYNAQFRHLESEELRLRFGSAYQVTHVPKPLYFYRRHDQNQSGVDDEREEYRKRIKELEAKS